LTCRNARARLDVGALEGELETELLTSAFARQDDWADCASVVGRRGVSGAVSRLSRGLLLVGLLWLGAIGPFLVLAWALLLPAELRARLELVRVVLTILLDYVLPAGCFLAAGATAAALRPPGGAVTVSAVVIVSLALARVAFSLLVGESIGLSLVGIASGRFFLAVAVSLLLVLAAYLVRRSPAA
jgi:hypothetical protein